MRLFAALYAELDATTRTSDKIAALARYFRAAPAVDAAWALAFLIGRRPKRAIAVGRMLAWAADEARVPLWLAEESAHATGDLGETLALLVPDPPASAPPPLHELVERDLLPLVRLADDERRDVVLRLWRRLDATQRLLLHKLISGEFRVGVSRALVVRALAKVADAPPATIAHRLMGDWSPTAEVLRRILSPDAQSGDDLYRPYPFFLAHPLHDEPATLGALASWQAEWKWDGIRAQLLHRRGATAIWSRGEEMVTAQFPEIATDAESLPDAVLDGEILAWDADADAPRPFASLQRRLNRREVSPALIAEVPLAFIAYDLLERDRVDLRALPLVERRERLAALLADAPPRFRLSPLVEAASWDELAAQRARSRELGVEGVMLKRRDAPYGVGRTANAWWKWKIAPYTVDAVLIYAQPGHGQRAGLFTDYTFGVWHDGALVPVAKAYSGLSQDEIHEVDRFVRAHTIERFGPVRRVEPRLVFELAFEGIQRSTRHKAGIAVRFPRMARWRRDKKPEEADTLASLAELIDQHGSIVP